MPVGGFPGLVNSRRRTIRAQVNPMDKATIVSIYPREIDEIHPTVQPGRFHIDAGTYEKPSILIVGPSSWWKEIDEEQPLLEIPNSSIQVADAVVKGYCSGLLACDMGTSMPGIFWVPGAFEIKEIRAKNQHLIDKAKTNQERWFFNLVKLADGLWARTNGSPLVIDDNMRMAARSLGLNMKDWMKDFTLIQKVPCPACGAARNAEFPVCQTCHAIIDPAKAKELGIVFAVR
jgi:hypothetical protein